MNIFKQFWYDLFPPRAKEPFTSERAYCNFAAEGRATSSLTLEKIMDDFLTELHMKIEDASRTHTYLLFDFPLWANKEHRQSIITALTDVRFQILYQDDEICLISWKML